MPTSASAARNAPTLASVFIPVSTSVHVSPARIRYTLTIVGRIGSGRWTRTTPSATSRVFATSRMLLVEPLLDGERQADAHLPGVHGAVLDQRRDPGHVRLADAVDRRGRAVDREPDGVLDRVGRRP